MADVEVKQQEMMMEQDSNSNSAPAPASAPEDERKLFAGGLPQDAKEAEIREHFGKFGEIESIMLKTDQHTGRSRGFCFVLYKTVDGLKGALVEADNHVMKGKKVAVKQAEAKQGKIYVGKLKPELSDESIKNFFANYGTIANIEQPFDKMKNERKNFCFITFDKEDVAKRLLKEATVTIEGHELDVKKVTVKAQNQMDPRSMYGGRGGAHAGHHGGHGHGGWGPAYPPQHWGGGYGDYWGGPQGGYGDYNYYGGYGYGYPPAGPGGPPGGKTPRGGAAGGGNPRGMMRGGRGGGGGGGMQRGAQRQKPY